MPSHHFELGHTMSFTYMVIACVFASLLLVTIVAQPSYASSITFVTSSTTAASATNANVHLPAGYLGYAYAVATSSEAVSSVNWTTDVESAGGGSTGQNACVDVLCSSIGRTRLLSDGNVLTSGSGQITMVGVGSNVLFGNANITTAFSNNTSALSLSFSTTGSNTFVLILGSIGGGTQKTGGGGSPTLPSGCTMQQNVQQSSSAAFIATCFEPAGSYTVTETALTAPDAKTLLIYKLPRNYTVTLDDNPAGGSINFNGTTYLNGQKTKAIGAYTINAIAPPGYYFSRWSASNAINVSISNAIASNTIIQIGGNDIITATYNALPSLIATPNTISNEIIDVGTSYTFNTVISDGTPPYTGNWSWTPPASSNMAVGNTPVNSLSSTPGGNTLQLTVNPTAINSITFTQLSGVTVTQVASGPNTILGAWTFDGHATDSNSTAHHILINGTNNSPVIIVKPALVANAPTPSAPKIDIGQSITLTANPSGGTGSYTYQWYSTTTGSCSSSSTPVASGNSVTLTNSPISNTIFCYTLTDTSSNAPTVTSVNVIVTVNPDLIAGNPSPSTANVDLGQGITITAHPSEGTAPYAYQWYSSTGGSCGAANSVVASGTSSTVTNAPTSNTLFCYTVTDNSVSPVTMTSGNALVTVNPALIAGNPSPSTANVDLGQGITLTANPSGGTGSYTYQWYSTTTGSCSSSSTPVASGNSVTLTNSPISNTIFCYTLTDTSSNAPTVTSVNVIVTVNPDLIAGNPSPSTANVDLGQGITITAHPSEGTAPYAYQWYSSTGGSCGAANSVVASGTSSTVTNAPTSNTLFCYTVTDNSVSPVTMTSGNALVTVNPDLIAGNPSPSTANVDLGQGITLTANPSGGTGSYTYQWYSSTGGSCGAANSVVASGTSSTVTNAPTSNTLFCYTVTDTSTNAPVVTSGHSTVTVNNALVAGKPTPSSPAIDSGQPITLTANESGGTGSYTYQWYSTTTGSCSSSSTPVASGNSVTLTNSPISNTIFCYTVTDTSSNAPTVTSVNVIVTVNPDLIAGNATTSSPEIDLGQSITITAHPSEGTAPYAYQWYSSTGGSCGAANSVVASGTSSTVTNAPTSNTLFCYTVTDNSVSPVTMTSGNVLVNVKPALLAGIPNPVRPKTDSGQQITLSVNVSGGTPPYTYEWYYTESPPHSSTICGSAYWTSALTTFPTYAPSPTSNTYFCYTVTDNAFTPVTNQSANDLVSVSNSLIAPSTPIVLNKKIDQNQTATLIGTIPTSGTSPYSYKWLVKIPGSGNFIAANSTLCAVPSGSNQIAGNVVTCSFVTNTLIATGNYLFELNVSDAAYNPESAASGSNTVIVDTALTSPYEPTVIYPILDQGQTATITDTIPSTGSPQYAYTWLASLNGGPFVTASECATQSGFNQMAGNTVTCSFATTPSTATGNYMFELQVSDNASTHVIVTSLPNSMVLNKALTAPSQPSISAPKLDSDQVESVTGIMPSTGTPLYSYAWLMSTNGGAYSVATKCASNSGSNQIAGNVVTCSIPANSLTAGDTYTLELHVNDSSSIPQTANSTVSSNIVVSSPISAPLQPSVSANVINVGEAETITANIPSTGTPLYSYAWLMSTNGGAYSVATKCASNSGSNQIAGNVVTCSISGNTLSGGNDYNFELQVTDSATVSESATSQASQTITVGSTATAQQPSVYAPYLDVNQNETINGVMPSNGISPFSYNWLVSTNSNSLYSIATQCITNSGTNEAYGNTVLCSIPPNTLTVGNTYNFELQVTDLSGTTTNSIHSNAVHVQSALTTIQAPTISASRLDQDQPSSITDVIPSTGTPLYSYAWLMSTNGGAYSVATKCASNSGSNQIAGNVVTCSIPGNTLSGGNDYNFELQVADSATVSESATSSASPTVAVKPELTPPSSPTINNVTIDQGQLSTIEGTMPNTGTPPFTYNWLVQPPGSLVFMAANSTLCAVPSGSNQIAGNTVLCQFATNSLTTPGNYLFALNVIDDANTTENAISPPTSNSVNVYSFTANQIVINGTTSTAATQNSIVNVTITQGSYVTLNVTVPSGYGVGPFIVDIEKLDPTTIATNTIPIGGGSATFDLGFNTTGVTSLESVITDTGTSPPYVFNISKTNVDVIPKAAPVSGGGGGGFGGGGGPVNSTTPGGASGPQVIQDGPACYLITRFATFSHATVYFPSLERSFFVYESVISTNYSTEIINNNATYNTYLGQKTLIAHTNTTNFTLELINVSYVPILHTVELQLCGQSIPVAPKPLNSTVYITIKNSTITATSSNTSDNVALLTGGKLLSSGTGVARYNLSQLLPGTYTITGLDTVTDNYSTVFYIRPKYTPQLVFLHECANYTYDGLGCTTIAEVISIHNQLQATMVINNVSMGSTYSKMNSTEVNPGTYDYAFETSGNANYSAASITYNYKIGDSIITVISDILAYPVHLADAIAAYGFLIILVAALLPPFILLKRHRNNKDIVTRLVWGLSNGWSVTGVRDVRLMISKKNAWAVVINSGVAEKREMKAIASLANQQRVRVVILDSDSDFGRILKSYDNVGVVLRSKSKRENVHPLIKNENRIILRRVKKVTDSI